MFLSLRADVYGDRKSRGHRVPALHFFRGKRILTLTLILLGLKDFFQILDVLVIPIERVATFVVGLTKWTASVFSAYPPASNL